MEKDQNIIEEKPKKSFKTKLLNILIIIVILIMGVYLYAKYVGTSGVFTREYFIKSNNIPKNFSGSKIVYFSDVLIGSTTSEDTLNEIKDKVNELNPDIILFGGGLISNTYKINDKTKLIEYLKGFNALLGKYASLGKNDSNEIKELLIESGFTYLDNNSELIYKNGDTPICLIGMNSYLLGEYSLENINKCANYFTVIFTHESDLLYKLTEYNYDMFLAGGTLGGEVEVPFYGPIYKFEGSMDYYKSEYDDNGKKAYISNGFGTKKSYIRLNNRPSFNFFRLKSTD